MTRIGPACGILALLASCGRFGFEPLDEAGAPDTGPNTEVTIPDAGRPDARPVPDAPPGPFGSITPIAELWEPDAADDDPSLTGDLLELYFKSDRGSPGDFDIWLARRGAVGDPWDPPERIDELSSAAYDATPEVSVDGLVIHISSARSGGLGGADIWRSARPSRDDPWSAPVHVTELSSFRDEWAAVTDAGETYAVITRSAAGGSLDLLGSSRAAADRPWGDPVPLANLSSDVYEADAHLDADGLRLCFGAELVGGDGRDLYVSQRASPADDFTPPERLVELSSAGRDEDPWMSPDGSLIVFSSDRSGDQELYWASR